MAHAETQGEARRSWHIYNEHSGTAAAVAVAQWRQLLVFVYKP
jgi:hypothetical protein